MIIYGAFPRAGVKSVSRTIASLRVLYPELSPFDTESGIQLETSDASATILPIQAASVAQNLPSRDGMGFVAAEDTQEAVALCWNALQAMVLEHPSDVWINQQMYSATEISRFAELRPMVLKGGDCGHLLRVSEFDALLNS